MLSPNVRIDSLAIKNGTAFVVRDDLLQGGTKQRAAAPYVTLKHTEGAEEFVYASPFCGFAQVALAVACKMVKVPCRLFCESDPTATNGTFASESLKAHEFSELAAHYGATLVLTESLSEAQRQAAEYVKQRSGTLLVPLGFDCEEFRHYLTAEVQKQWSLVQAQVGPRLRTLWLPVGSGTLAGVFRSVVHPEIPIRGINVRVLADADSRIQRIAQLPNVTLQSAPQKFFERARLVPPIASNAHYDAKIWELLNEQGRDGDVWWNVAR